MTFKGLPVIADDRDEASGTAPRGLQARHHDRHHQFVR